MATVTKTGISDLVKSNNALVEPVEGNDELNGRVKTAVMQAQADVQRMPQTAKSPSVSLSTLAKKSAFILVLSFFILISLGSILVYFAPIQERWKLIGDNQVAKTSLIRSQTLPIYPQCLCVDCVNGQTARPTSPVVSINNDQDDTNSIYSSGSCVSGDIDFESMEQMRKRVLDRPGSPPPGYDWMKDT